MNGDLQNVWLYAIGPTLGSLCAVASSFVPYPSRDRKEKETARRNARADGSRRCRESWFTGLTPWEHFLGFGGTRIGALSLEEARWRDSGVGLSSEELSAREIVRAAALAEEVGFRDVWVSDHFHPWIDAQGESPFVWSTLGAISSVTELLRIGTGVTCPILRIHPAIIAQAAATTQTLFEGRFWLGVGSGEALNEHIFATKWPEARVRLEMLEEAVAVIRRLWSGESVSHYGTHFQVENARIYSLPDVAPPIYVSAFGEQSARVVARIGDGLVSTKPVDDIIRRFRGSDGIGPTLAQVKVVWADSVGKAEDLAFERWPTSGLEIYVTQVGPDQLGFLRFYERVSLPVFAEHVGAA